MLRPTRLSSLRALSTPPYAIRLPTHSQKRLASFFTPPSQKPRSFKGGLARWGLAGGALYWYMTRDEDVLSQDAQRRILLNGRQRSPLILETHDESEELPTIETLATTRRQRQAEKIGMAPADACPVAEPASSPSPSFNANMASTQENDSPSSSSTTTTTDGAPVATSDANGNPSSESTTTTSSTGVPPSPGSLEQEAESEGAFNEETGEINWDCPCLGGMAYGPCGEHFRDAFSCFVFSNEEPKGIDCIERFKTMQDCFRQHPDIYGAELTDDPDMDADPDELGVPPPQPETASAKQSQTPDQSGAASTPPPSSSAPPASLTSSPSAAPDSLLEIPAKNATLPETPLESSESSS